MLLPFEFLFPRGFFCGRYTCCFSPHLLLEILNWCELLKIFWWKRFWTLLWRFVIQTVYVRTDNWIMASVTERKYFMDWLLFPWIWLLELTSDITGNCFVRIRNFCSGFCFKFISIKGLSSGIYLWNWSELHVGTWTEHLRGFLQGICFCDQGLCERILFG